MGFGASNRALHRQKSAPAGLSRLPGGWRMIRWFALMSLASQGCGLAADDPLSPPADVELRYSGPAMVPANLGCSTGEHSAEIAPPHPDTSACPPQDLWADAYPHGPNLNVELGVWTQDGQFAPWQPDALLPLVHGPQGGFHIELSVRVRGLVGVKQDAVTVDFKGFTNAGCTLASLQSNAPISLKSSGPQGWLHTAAPGSAPAVRIVFPVNSPKSYLYCGQWLEVHGMVRHPASKQWGVVHHRIRVYDTYEPVG